MGVWGMNNWEQGWGWRRWTWVTVGIGELHFKLPTGVNATPQHFLLPCSALGFTVFALLWFCLSKASYARIHPWGVKTHKSSLSSVFFPMVQSTGSLRE